MIRQNKSTKKLSSLKRYMDKKEKESTINVACFANKTGDMTKHKTRENIAENIKTSIFLLCVKSVDICYVGANTLQN